MRSWREKLLTIAIWGHVAPSWIPQKMLCKKTQRYNLKIQLILMTRLSDYDLSCRCQIQDKAIVKINQMKNGKMIHHPKTLKRTNMKMNLQMGGLLVSTQATTAQIVVCHPKILKIWTKVDQSITFLLTKNAKKNHLSMNQDPLSMLLTKTIPLRVATTVRIVMKMSKKNSQKTV